MANAREMPRRRFVQSVATALLPCVVVERAAAIDHGRIYPPIAVPDIPLRLHDGRAMSLPELLRQRATALQVMFTSCTSTCPIQGAIFRRVQALIADQAARGIQLVSLTVDPERDTPAALAKWLSRFGARPGWVAAAPRSHDVERVRGFAGRGASAADNHSTRFQITNRDAQLIWRTHELPEAEEIAAMLTKI